MVNTSQFEGVKVALKQDKTGYILTLSMHPDEVPVELLRDFVGARYMVVLARINESEKIMDRDKEYSRDLTRSSAMLCRDPLFHEWLYEINNIFDETEEEATRWLKEELKINSRSEIKPGTEAAKQYNFIYQEFLEWKKQKN